MTDSTLSSEIFFDRVEARAFSRATEVVERVRIACFNLFPEELRKKIKVRIEKTEGHLHDPIQVIHATLSGKRNCDKAFTYLLDNLSEEDQRNLLRSLDIRLDEKCVFFVRIDKQSAYLNNIHLGNRPDLIRISYHIRQYPRCERDKAKAMIVERIRDIGALD